MLYCVACDKNTNCKSSHQIYYSYKLKKNFRIKDGLRDRTYKFDESDGNQLDNKLEKTVEGFMQFFHRFKNKCENETKNVRRENRADEACCTIPNTYRISFDPIDEIKTIRF